MEPSRQQRDRRRFVCHLCERGFASQSNLRRHVASIHAMAMGIVVMCDICEQGFTTRAELLQHLQSHLSDNNVFRIVQSMFERSCLRYRCMFTGPNRAQQSILQAMANIYDDARELVLLHVAMFRTLRVSMSFSAIMIHDDFAPGAGGNDPRFIERYFRVWCPMETQVLVSVNEVDRYLERAMIHCQTLLERVQVDRSNISLDHIQSCHLDFFRCNVVSASCGSELVCIQDLKEVSLSKKSGASNHESDDEEEEEEEDEEPALQDCFITAVASQFVDEKDRNNLSVLRQFAREHFVYSPSRDLPMSLQGMDTFERQQNYKCAINVYSLERSRTKQRARHTNLSVAILRRSTNVVPGTVICNLLLIRIVPDAAQVALTGKLKPGSVVAHFVRMANLSKCLRVLYPEHNYHSKIHVHFCANCMCRLYAPSYNSNLSKEEKTELLRTKIAQHERVCYQNAPQRLVMPILAKEHELTERRIAAASLVAVDTQHEISDDSLIYRDDEDQEEEDGEKEEEEGWQHKKVFDSASFVFKNPQRRIECEVLAFFDFETLIEPLIPTDDAPLTESGRKNEGLVRIGKHIPYMFSLLICSTQEDILHRQTYTGLDAAKKFVETLLDLEPKLLAFCQRFPKLQRVSAAQRQTMRRRQNNVCWICKKKLLQDVNSDDAGFLDDDSTHFFRPQGENDNVSQNYTVVDHSHALLDPNTKQPLIYGLAHQSCNILRRRQLRFPVVAHNGQKFDNNLWLTSLQVDALKSRGYEVKLAGVAANSESFKILRLNRFEFVDSLHFLNSSLDSIVDTARKSECQFKILKQMPTFKNVPDHLLFAKSCFPYEAFSSIEDMKACREFPSRDTFYSQLRGETVSREDYAQAKTLYELSNCDNMLSFSVVYCELDVGLLASAFILFRRQMYDWCGLDAAKSISLASLTLDVFLSRHKPDIELLTDETMYLTFSSTLRGGLSQAVSRYVQAGPEVNLAWYEDQGKRLPGNDSILFSKPLQMDAMSEKVPALRDAFPIFQRSSPEGELMSRFEEHLRRRRYKDIYAAKELYRVCSILDLNSLYATAMRSKLPQGDFAWVPDHELNTWTSDKIMSLPDDGPEGVTFVVDIEYSPQKAMCDPIHSLLPVIIDRQTIHWQDLSPYTKSCFHQQWAEQGKSGPHPDVYQSHKLVASMGVHKHYTVGFRLLKFLLTQGVKLLRVRSGITYTQSSYIRNYVDECVDLRRRAKSPLEAQNYKLVLNSLYGKLVESTHLYKQSRFVWSEKQFLKAVSDPMFHRLIPINDSLAFVSLNKSKLPCNRPVATAHVILDEAKLLFLRDIHTRLTQICPPEMIDIAYLDTDSLFFSTVVSDPNRAKNGGHLEPLKDVMDFSNFSAENPLHDLSRKGQLGLWKSELADLNIREMVSIRAKVYCVRYDQHESTTTTGSLTAEKVAIKGIKMGVARREARFDMMKKALSSRATLCLEQQMIQGKRFQPYTIKQRKRFAQVGDDKRHLFHCGLHSLPLGHPAIEKIPSADLLCTRCLRAKKQKHIKEYWAQLRQQQEQDALEESCRFNYAL